MKVLTSYWNCVVTTGGQYEPFHSYVHNANEYFKANHNDKDLGELFDIQLTPSKWRMNGVYYEVIQYLVLFKYR